MFLVRNNTILLKICLSSKFLRPDPRANHTHCLSVIVNMLLHFVGSGFSEFMVYYQNPTFYFHIQGGPQQCPYFSLAITFTKTRKPSRFFLHRYWKFIEFFWWKPL